MGVRAETKGAEYENAKWEGGKIVVGTVTIRS
jgi:hypothetical protein